jgi:hypothetical protein
MFVIERACCHIQGTFRAFQGFGQAYPGQTCYYD